MTEGRLSLGINVSILVILTIFGVLLSLPLRLLLDTKYYRIHDENDTSEESFSMKSFMINAVKMDFRKLKRCPMLQYPTRMMYTFHSYYDGNCTRIPPLLKNVEEEIAEEVENITSSIDISGIRDVRLSKGIPEENVSGNVEDIQKNRQMKSIPVAGHILVAMLLISAVAALIEVLRARFASDKHKDSPRGGTSSPRKNSTVDLPVQRRFFTQREPMRSQRSFELQGMHRSALRLLGARPPPLIRRSSFPTQQAKQTLPPSLTGTPKRISRRQSAESDEEIGLLINALHHRTRLIRRH